MAETTIAIIDDHEIVRHGLKELLKRLGGYTVTHEFVNGAEFINALPLSNPPQIYILDYSMPMLNGLEVLTALEKLKGEYRVLFLTQHFDETLISDAYRLGARGFLHKNCSAQELQYAIDSIVSQGYCNIGEILQRITNYPKPTKDVDIHLSDREIELMTLICDENEYTYEQMSEIMGISVKTIEAYRSRLYERFGIKTKVGLVLLSYRYGLTKPFK